MDTLLKTIENMSDKEILSLAMPRPGHPGQYGFMLDPKKFHSAEECARVMDALMRRLGKVENMAEKMKEKKLTKE